jgi:hypothetical protein
MAAEGGNVWCPGHLTEFTVCSKSWAEELMIKNMSVSVFWRLSCADVAGSAVLIAIVS